MTTATPTLADVKAEQTRLAEMIARIEEAATKSRVVSIPALEITLKEGEHYAGIILGENGKPTHHVILLPGQAEDINWKDATDWAAKSGGDLPTRNEQSLLYANLKDQFEQRWYWSSEAYASDSGYAWLQLFAGGLQLCSSVNFKLRARAVRRLVIE